ncbi:MAG: GFA family protein [Pseudomonadota bacterium]
MAEPTTPMRGGCLCGAVRYELRGKCRNVVGCHCGQCLKTHGNFAAYSAVAKDDLVLTEDRGLTWYVSSDKARRGFCRECGASLFWEPTFDDYVAVSAGSMDGPTGLKLVRHIFTQDKPDWYDIADGAEQFETSMYGVDAG